MQTIVIGHKNPDMDSICSALAYAHLKRELGVENVCAARAGATNERIDYVLEKFHVSAPVFISDLSPKVLDVMQPNVVSVGKDDSVYEAMQMVEKYRLRGLPVVDEDKKCLGLLSMFMISHHFFPSGEEAALTREVYTSLLDIARVLEGKVLAGGEGMEVEEQLKLMVVAMSVESFSRRYEAMGGGKNVVMITGDREQVQEMGIDYGVKAIVITGGVPVSEKILKKAEAAGVTILGSPQDTATTVLMARGAVHAGRMIEEDYICFNPNTSLEAARKVAADASGFVFPVVDEEERLVGILSKSDFLRSIPRQLILVDHNELSQAVDGADQVPIVEILDHHKIGGFSTSSPMLFWNNPVGSTSTIVAMCYEQAGVPIPKPMAGLLMAGLISDTLNLTSPTATPTDEKIMKKLSEITGEDPAQLAEEIFSVGSPLLTLTPEQAVVADSKEYEESGVRFTVAQIEELNFSHFEEKEEALREALETHQKGNRLFFAALMVTDINTQNSRLLVAGPDQLKESIDFPLRSVGVWEMAGVVSRKKQLLPFLLTCLEETLTASV